MSPSQPNRREFLQATTAAGVIAASMAGVAEAQTGQQRTNAGGIPLRPLGRTGEMVSLLCLGGYSATDLNKMSEPESLRLIQRAVAEGITFLDNAWDYHDGGAEERMGKALAEGKLRDKVFLMTKVCGRTAKDAQSNLEDSLRRLKTDRIDLWQFHEMVYDNDPDWVFAEDGAIHAGLKALKDGKVRYLGFTGPQGPVDPPQDAGQALRLGDRPDAAERHGRPLPQLPEAGPSRAAPAQHRRARHEEPGRQRLDRHQGRRAGGRRLALRPLTADLHARLGDRLGEGPRPEPQNRPRVQAALDRGAGRRSRARPWPWPATGGSSCSSRRRRSTGRCTGGSMGLIRGSREGLVGFSRDPWIPCHSVSMKEPAVFHVWVRWAT